MSCKISLLHVIPASRTWISLEVMEILLNTQPDHEGFFLQSPSCSCGKGSLISFAVWCALSLSRPSLFFSPKSFTSKTLKHLTCNHNPWDTAVLQRRFQFYRAILMIRPFIIANGKCYRSVSTSKLTGPREKLPFENTLKPELAHPCGQSWLTVQMAAIFCSKCSQLYLIFIPSLTSQVHWHPSKCIVSGGSCKSLKKTYMTGLHIDNWLGLLGNDCIQAVSASL